MRNALLDWNDNPAIEGVTSYKVYVGKAADALQLFTNIRESSIVFYPDQMPGFAVGDTLFAAVSAVAETTEGPKSEIVSVILQASPVAPTAPTGLVLTNVPF